MKWTCQSAPLALMVMMAMKNRIRKEKGKREGETGRAKTSPGEKTTRRLQIACLSVAAKKKHEEQQDAAGAGAGQGKKAGKQEQKQKQQAAALKCRAKKKKKKKKEVTQARAGSRTSH